MKQSPSKKSQLIYPEIKRQLSCNHKGMQNDQSSLIQKSESYLNIQLMNLQGQNKSPSLVSQFNAKLKRCIKQRNVNALLKSRSRPLFNQLNRSTLQNKQKKLQTNLIIMDGQQIKQKSFSLDVRINKKAYPHAESRHLKSLTSQKKTISRIPLLNMLSDKKSQKLHSIKSYEQKLKDKETQKRSKLIKSILNRYHINRQICYYAEEDKNVKNCQEKEIKEPLLAIIRFPIGPSPSPNQQATKICSENKIGLRRSIDKPRKQKEYRQFKQMIVSSKLSSTKEAINKLKHSGKNIIYSKSNCKINILSLGQDISPWYFKQTEFD